MASLVIFLKFLCESITYRQIPNAQVVNKKCKNNTKIFWYFSHESIKIVWKLKRYGLTFYDQWRKSIVLKNTIVPEKTLWQLNITEKHIKAFSFSSFFLDFFTLSRWFFPGLQEKNYCQAPYFREMKSYAQIFPEVNSLLLIRKFDNIVNTLWWSCWKYIFRDCKCLPLFDLFALWYYLIRKK